MKETIGERFQKARKFLRYSQSQIGEKIGLHKSNVGKVEGGKQELKAKQMKLFCNEFGISPTWLLYGKGPMLENTESDSPDTNYSMTTESLVDLNGLIGVIEDLRRRVEDLEEENKKLK